MVLRKVLAVFDFDQTIVDENCDIVIQELAPDGFVADDFYEAHSEYSWPDYMGAFFRYLHSIGMNSDNYKACLSKMQLTDGMNELLEFLHDNNVEVIIISDANMYFIETILQSKGIQNLVSKIYTNPAHFNENQCLCLSYYHIQETCSLSSRNLCKGDILEEHISKNREAGIEYVHVIYVGDGENDLCPSLRLQEKDVLYPRKNFALHRKTSTAAVRNKLKANVVVWESGVDIKTNLLENQLINI